MIVVDTSALFSIVAVEPDWRSYDEALRDADAAIISAVTLFEARAVVGGRFDQARLAQLELLVAKIPIEIVAFDAEQAIFAYDAYRMFGKGSGHKAQLNFADCAAYALAASKGIPLLYKGQDFSRTDIESVL